mgnify:CR=1 FL=1
MESEVAMLLANAKDDLEGAAFATGSGSSQPTGIVTALVAGSRTTATSTANAIVLADVYTVAEAVGPRFRRGASWVMNYAILNDIRQLGTANNYNGFTVDLTAAGESDDLDDTVDYGAVCEAISRVVSSERYELIERLATRIAAAPAACALLSADPLWIAALRRFEQQATVLEGRPVGSTLTHGDFTSTNLLLGAGRVTGIDLWAHRRSPAVDDLARMFVYLAMGDPLPFTARLRPVPLEARRAMQALFEGYGADLAAELDREVWRHVVLYETLARWVALAGRLAQRASFTESWKRGGLRALVRTILDD